MILKFKEDDLDQHDKVESLRNKLVGESHPYKGLFRKKRVANQRILSCLFTPQPLASAHTVVAQTRYDHG